MEKQNLDVVYVGVFFDACEVEAWQKAFDDEGLDRNIEYPHVTLKFRPTEDEVAMLQRHVGNNVDFVVDAYGNNNENAGFRICEWFEACEDVANMLEAIKLPHITTSVSSTGRPVNTPKVFEKGYGAGTFPIKPFVIKGKIGMFCSDGAVHYSF